MARNTPLRRRVAIKPVSDKRKVENAERREVIRRVQPVRCEARIPGCQGRTLDTHEIRTRARLGSIVDADNFLHVCRQCHDTITHHPRWADRHGFTISSWATTEDERGAWLARLHYDFCTVECTTDHVSRWRMSPYDIPKREANA
jgi:hypothetical protein